MHKIIILILISILAFSLTGCTAAQKGMAIGALGGAAAGGAIGYFVEDEEQTDHALVGAGIGAVSGAVIGGIIGYLAEE